MQIKNLATIVRLILAAVTVTNVASTCSECLTNGVACFNETSFYMCYGANADKVDTSVALNCPENEVCTGLQTICAPADQIDPVCGVTPGCGICGVGAFTCTSRSMFALCSGGEITDVSGKCPGELICDSSSTSSNICVKPCGAIATCSFPDPVV